MKSRISVALFLIALPVLLSGCPTPSVSPGVWIFNVDGNNRVFGLELASDGSTQTPDPLPPETNSFDGILTWEQDGATFILTQLRIVSTVVYTGTVDSRTSIIDGTYEVTVGDTSDSGTWTAMKL